MTRVPPPALESMSIAPPIASNLANKEPETDVPVGDGLADDRGIETPAVVGDRQLEPVPFTLQPDAHVLRTGMLADVGEQFASGPVQQLLGVGLTHFLQIGIDGDLGASLELLQQLSQRRCEPELGQHLRVQLRDGRTQAGRGFLQCLIDHVQRGIGVPLTGFVEFQPRGEQRLQRAVVQVLGHFAVCVARRPASPRRPAGGVLPVMP